MKSALMNLIVGSCEETAARLSEYLEGDLARLRRLRVAAHLRGCERCRAVLRSLARAVEQLRVLGRPQPRPAPSVADAVLARIRRAER